MEVGENIVEAVKREIMEESGIDVSVGELFCISSNTARHSGYNGVKEVPTKVMMDFICRYVGGTARTSEENSETAWFAKKDVLDMTRPEFILQEKRDF